MENLGSYADFFILDLGWGLQGRWGKWLVRAKAFGIQRLVIG